MAAARALERGTQLDWSHQAQYLCLFVGAFKLPGREGLRHVYESSGRGSKRKVVVMSHIFWIKRAGGVHANARARAVTAAG
jgi:hypothetical protein